MYLGLSLGFIRDKYVLDDQKEEGDEDAPVIEMVYDYGQQQLDIPVTSMEGKKGNDAEILLGVDRYIEFIHLFM